ncbi:uncharacterized protein MONBRDRAFT_37439 [Monosiga brevicollis MX1]|uniref:AAA ATPase AAA+ lid domain-containing protein n=1 Tax=Monosiga brevicollis TaxID=81824 RepID=A9V1R3_MONBE|nr:uncharacterized protein MONBRDRAFT_37439 [Monosiga brevicollis MX1]EDQ88491.1 predicted protein [Monosiga brevicollis MX1]|eukprot:XP_001746595.1 hypothetical protein [Monosiga brevicollis MX1]
MATAAPPTNPAAQTATNSKQLQEIQRRSRQGYTHLVAALNEDQQGHLHHARQLYTEGLVEYLAALQIPVDASDPHAAEARELQAKIRQNYDNARNRLDQLVELSADQAGTSTHTLGSKGQGKQGRMSPNTSRQHQAVPAMVPHTELPSFMRNRAPSASSDVSHRRVLTPTSVTPRASSAPAVDKAKPIAAKPLAAKPMAAKPEQAPPKHDNLKNIDHKMAHRILNEIVDSDPGVTLDDIIGLKEAKQALHETVILPSLRPDLFTGLRKPAKGILLVGPPGNGKTMLAKIDSLLMARNSEEQESSRRMKTEIFIQVSSNLSKTDLVNVAKMTDGYSCSDLTALVRDAAMGPIRELGARLADVAASDVRPVLFKDFVSSMKQVRPSVPRDTIQALEAFARDYAYSANG